MTYSRKDLIAAARLSLTRAIDLIDDGDERCIADAARAAWEAAGMLLRADHPTYCVSIPPKEAEPCE